MSLKEKIFVIISSVVIVFCFAFYGYRLVHYYRLENPKNTETTPTYTKLGEKILLTHDSSNGLFKDNEKNIYYFNGKVDNNYLQFSGKMWRIVSIDEDGNIKIILDEAISSLSYGDEYEKSYVRSWLNPSDNENEGIFYNSLSDKGLIYTTIYVDKIDDISKIKSDKKHDDYIGLLSLYEYYKAGGKDSYLNNGTEWWLSTTTTDSKAWYVSKDKLAKADYETYANKGIRPVITLNYNTALISGSGTKTDPFITEERQVEALSDVLVGEYVNYSDYTWLVIGKSNESIKLLLTEELKDLNRVFDTKNNTFDLSNKNNIAYYLNNTFYKKLDNKEYIVETDWYNGEYGNSNYDYKEIYKDKIEAKVGLLSISDLYVNKYKENCLINPSEDGIYTISDDNTIYNDEVDTKKQIRPVINLKLNLNITSGNGTTDPYVIGGEIDGK